MATVIVQLGKYVFPSGPVSTPTTVLTLADSSTAATGDGNYSIYMNSGGTLVVVKGKPAGRSSTLQLLATAIVTNNGTKVFVRDRRNLQVPIEPVNHVVAPVPGPDGSYIIPGAIGPSAPSQAQLNTTGQNQVQDPNFNFANYGDGTGFTIPLAGAETAATPFAQFPAGLPGVGVKLPTANGTAGNLVVLAIAGDATDIIPGNGWTLVGIHGGGSSVALCALLWKVAAPGDPPAIAQFTDACWVSWKTYEFTIFDPTAPLIFSDGTDITLGASGPMTASTGNEFPIAGSLGFQVSSAAWYGSDPVADVPPAAGLTSLFTQTDSVSLGDSIAHLGQRAYFDSKNAPVTSAESLAGITGEATIGANMLTGTLTGTTLSVLTWFVQPYVGTVSGGLVGTTPTAGGIIGSSDPYWNLEVAGGLPGAFYLSGAVQNVVAVMASLSGIEVTVISAAPIPVIAGITYNFAADIEAGAVTSGAPFIALLDSTQTVVLAFINLGPGQTGPSNANWTCPVGIDEVYFQMSTGGCGLSGPFSGNTGTPALTMAAPSLTAGVGYKGYSLPGSVAAAPTGATELVALSDVILTTPAGGDVLTFDSSVQKWENIAPTLAADTDVDITSPVDGQVLVYSASAGKWLNSGPLPKILGSGTSDPASGMIEGDLFYRSDLPALRVYTGSAWANV